MKHKQTKDITKTWESDRPMFSYRIADDEGYFMCFRCHGTGMIGGLLRKRRECPECLGRARVSKALGAGRPNG